MSPAPHTPAEYEAMRAESEAALAQVRAGEPVLLLDLAEHLGYFDLPWQLHCPQGFEERLEGYQHPDALVALVCLAFRPRDALGLFPVRQEGDRWRLTLPHGGQLAYRVVEGRWPTVELHALDDVDDDPDS